MKLLWASNAPWCSTGYGTQTAQVTRHLRDAGHDVAIACNYGLQQQAVEWEEITCYPSGWEQWSNDIFPHYYRDHCAGEPGWFVSLMDVWVFDNRQWESVNFAAWTPVDHLPLPPRVAMFFRTYNAVPIAMSKFGKAQLEKELDIPALYAPHGIDTVEYRPRPTAEARERVGLPGDAFVVGMVANNKGRLPSRKSFPEAFLAFAAFQREHPDAVLYVHAECSGIAMGLDLQLLAESCGIPAQSLLFADQHALRIGLPDSMMADLYSGFDVLLSPSRGEGFGIPVVEAQACGTPVIVTDATAQPELCGAGWLVTGQPEWDPDQGAWWTCPSVKSILDALEDAYDKRGNTGLRMDAREFAVQYDHRVVWEECWQPVLRDLEDMLPVGDAIVAEAVA